MMKIRTAQVFCAFQGTVVTVLTVELDGILSSRTLSILVWITRAEAEEVLWQASFFPVRMSNALCV